MPKRNKSSKNNKALQEFLGLVVLAGAVLGLTAFILHFTNKKNCSEGYEKAEVDKNPVGGDKDSLDISGPSDCCPANFTGSMRDWACTIPNYNGQCIHDNDNDKICKYCHDLVTGIVPPSRCGIMTEWCSNLLDRCTNTTTGVPFCNQKYNPYQRTYFVVDIESPDSQPFRLCVKPDNVCQTYDELIHPTKFIMIYDPDYSEQKLKITCEQDMCYLQSLPGIGPDGNPRGQVLRFRVGFSDDTIKFPLEVGSLFQILDNMSNKWTDMYGFDDSFGVLDLKVCISNDNSKPKLVIIKSLCNFNISFPVTIYNNNSNTYKENSSKDTKYEFCNISGGIKKCLKSPSLNCKCIDNPSPSCPNPDICKSTNMCSNSKVNLEHCWNGDIPCCQWDGGLRLCR